MNRKKYKKISLPTIDVEKQLLFGQSAQQQKRLDLLTAFILIAFGTYHSIILFGHQVVPNPDFTGFIESARQFWSGGWPHYFKRAPVLGFLQIPLGSLVGGPHPDLTGGWLLNALIHPFNLLLLWLVGRRIIGVAALWVTLLAMLNPWVLYLITEPLCETLLLFFTLLTLYFMFKRSKWCYLFASITTMIRFEGAALILAAVVLDYIYDRSRRNLLKAFLYAFIASIPLGLWLLAMKLNPGNAFYVDNLSITRLGNTLSVLESLQQVTFHPLFIPSATASTDAMEFVFGLTTVLAVISFIFGVIDGLIKRKWEVLALLIFLIPYMIIHILYTWSVPRFYASVHWIVLLICVLGFQCIWSLVNKNNRVPKPIVIFLQVLILATAVLWAANLLEYLPEIKDISPPSNLIPLIAGFVLILIFIVRRLTYRNTFVLRDAVISAVVMAMIISNQFMLVRIVGDGQRTIEFKLLAEWYTKNAKPDEKLLCSMSNVIEIFAPKAKGCFVHPGAFKADNPQDFIEKCYAQNINYVVWDSRIGNLPNDTNYKLWGIGNFAMLAKPQNIGPYEFLKTFQNEKYRGSYLNVFRLHKMPVPATKKTGTN